MSKSAGGQGRAQTDEKLGSNYISRQQFYLQKPIEPTTKMLINCIPVYTYTVSTSLHLKQFPKKGQNLALLEQKGN